MKILHTLMYPSQDVAKKIVDTLNNCDDTIAQSEFVTVIPRHIKIHIQINDDSSPNDILQLGALIGTLERY